MYYNLEKNHIIPPIFVWLLLYLKVNTNARSNITQILKLYTDYFQTVGSITLLDFSLVYIRSCFKKRVPKTCNLPICSPYPQSFQPQLTGSLHRWEAFEEFGPDRRCRSKLHWKNPCQMRLNNQIPTKHRWVLLTCVQPLRSYHQLRLWHLWGCNRCLFEAFSPSSSTSGTHPLAYWAIFKQNSRSTQQPISSGTFIWA